MLSNLKIENIAIIESAEIEFSDGLNVLSGETGAGKSIIIDALSSVLGERTSKDLIRSGTRQARVTALFQEISGDVADALRALDLEPPEDGSLLISRTLNADGRNVCKVNGSPVTVTMLRSVGKTLISLHGQHDSQNLLDPEYHYRYLDSLGGLDPLSRDYREKYQEFVGLYRTYRKLQRAAEDSAARIDFLRFEIDEMEAAGIRVGELEELKERRERFRNSEAIVRGLEKALHALDDADDTRGAMSRLFDASESLKTASRYLPDAESCERNLTEAAYAVQDAREEIRRILYESSYDPQEQSEIEARLAELQKIRAKYGQTEEQILDHLAAEKKELYDLEHQDEQYSRLEAELETKKGALLDAAEALSRARKETALQFEARVREELTFLNMPNVVIHTEFTHCKLTPVGSDNIEFLISTNPGEALKPLAKIASGGELSRIMLAIQNVLSSEGNVQTMIFDEIDAGVSGSEAERIARKLHRVSLSHQVLCITHSAQVAAYADAHYRIRKEVRDGMTYTRVQPLDRTGRVEELARILGGEVITDLNRENAGELIDRAEQQAKEDAS